MADVDISKYRAQVVRDGFRPSNPGFVESEGQNPVDPAGSGQNHLPVTIAAVSTGLAITDAQVLGGAGTVGQYIRGDGSLADFPATTGGGSSVSYYLNGSVSQGTIGGVAYRELNRNPIFGAGTDITRNSDGYIASFITDAGDPNKLLIPAGNWNFETYFSASSSGGTPSFYVELYKYDGTTFTLLASSATSPELIAFGTNLNPYFSTLAVPQTTLTLTDRLALRYYVNTSGRTITLHTENDHLCQVITTFTTGLTALNGLTSQVQFFAVGTSGTDFNIASATDTHTFNLPTASATNRGALSSGDWSTFNAKENAITAGTTAQYFRGDKTFQTLNTSVVPELTNLYYTEARVNANTNVAANTAARHNAVTLGTANGLSLSTQVLSLGLASAGVNGALSGTDWSTFNSKQNALTNPVTGTGTTNQIPKFTGASTIGNSNLTDGGVTILNENPTAGQFAWQFNGNTTTGQSFGASVVAGTNSSDISFRVLNAAANSTYFAIRGNGNTLIGTATDAGFKLDVNGTGRFSGASNLSTTVFTNTGNDGGIDVINSGTLANGRTSQLRLTNGTTFFGANDRTYQLINTGTSSTLSDFYIQYWNGSTYLERFRITSGGNVGIGVTPTAWDAGWLGGNTNTLEIGQLGSSFAAGAGGLLIGNNYIVNSGANKYARSFPATYYIQNTALGQHQWWNAPSGTAGNTITFTQAMTLTNGGNLLVGTTTDAGFKLDVNGTGRFSGRLNSTTLYVNSTEYTFANFVSAVIGPRPAADGIANLWLRPSDASNNVGFNLSATSSNFDIGSLVAGPFLRITSGGNVGIGTTSPAGELHIVNSSGSGQPVLELQQQNAGSNILQWRGSAGSYLGVITNGGNVLIGTTTDGGARLQVNGAVNSRAATTNAGLGATTFIGAGEFMSTGSLSGYFWENRSGGVTSTSNWYGWYTTSATIFLYNGSANIASINTSTGAYTALSDKNKKKDFEQSNLGLNEILNLKPTLYRMNSDSEDVKKQLGFIAQEVKEYIPQAYVESQDFIGLNYNSIIPVLVNAIKELKQEIDTLKN